MASETEKTFVFVGDTNMGKEISASLVAAGFRAAPRPSAADVVFTFRSSQSSLEDIYFESNGLLQSTKEGVVLVDLSAATPTFARELYGIASACGRTALDAPIVVHNMVVPHAFADPANLSLLVGGDAEVFRAVEPMLKAIAGQVMWMGEAGAGQVAKTVSTLQVASQLVGAIEAKAALGASPVAMDAEEIEDYLLDAGLITPVHQQFLEAVREEDFEGSFTIEYLMGELAAAMTAADDAELILPQAESGFRLMELLAMVGGVGYNPAALQLVFADEDAGKRYNLDWALAEGAFEEHECDCDDDCDCEDHDDPDHECDCGHHHH